jgi:hypothetical protein
MSLMVAGAGLRSHAGGMPGTAYVGQRSPGECAEEATVYPVWESLAEVLGEAEKPSQLDRTSWPCSKWNSSACRFPQRALLVSPTDTDAGPNHFIGNLRRILEEWANLLPIVRRFPLLVPTFGHGYPSSGSIEKTCWYPPW